MNGTPSQHEPDAVDHAVDALKQAPRVVGPSALLVERTVQALTEAEAKGTSGEARGSDSEAAGEPGIVRRATEVALPRWRSGRARRIFQLAAAIALILSIGVVSFLVVNSSRPALAFSTVVESLTSARTVVYDATITELKKAPASGSAIAPATAPSGDDDGMTMHISVLVPGRVRQEIGKLDMVQILNFDTAQGVALLEKDKLAIVIDMKGKLDHIRGDPSRFIIDQLKTTNSRTAEQLGRKKFGDRELVGFRVELEKVPCTVWADPQTGAAVRMEYDVVMGDGGIRILVDHIVFDRDLPASLFSTDAPAGYTVQKMSADISAPVEADLVKLLKTYADQTGGYPKDLNDVKSIYAALSLPTQPADFKRRPELVETAYALNRGLLFASTTVSRSPWYYAPAEVKPGDGGAVLLWYVTRDENEKAGPVHAIYGDLSVHEAKGESLPASNHAATATRPDVKF